MAKASHSSRRLSWRVEARELMTLCSVTGAAVGKVVGVAQPVIQRYFSISDNPADRRNPSPERAFAINLAISKIAVLPWIRLYLDGVFLAEKDPTAGIVELGLRKALSIHDRFFITDWVEMLIDVISGWSTKRRASFLEHVNALNRRHILHRVAGMVPRPSRFEDVTALFERFGIEYTPWQQTITNFMREQKRESFSLTLRSALQELSSDDVIGRNAAEEKISKAYVELLSWFADLQNAEQQNEDEDRFELASRREEVCLRHWEKLADRLPDDERLALFRDLYAELTALEVCKP